MMIHFVNTLKKIICIFSTQLLYSLLIMFQFIFASSYISNYWCCLEDKHTCNLSMEIEIMRSFFFKVSAGSLFMSLFLVDLSDGPWKKVWTISTGAYCAPVLFLSENINKEKSL